MAKAEVFETLQGVKCKVTYKMCGDGKKRKAFTFKVGDWEECTVTGKKQAERVIYARQMYSIYA